MIQGLLEEKGHLSLAALTIAEFIELLDTYKSDKQFSEKDGFVEMKEDHLIDLKTLEKELGSSRATIYRMRNKGMFPEYQVNGKPKFILYEVKRSIRLKKA